MQADAQRQGDDQDAGKEGEELRLEMAQAGGFFQPQVVTHQDHAAAPHLQFARLQRQRGWKTGEHAVAIAGKQGNALHGLPRRLQGREQLPWIELGQAETFEVQRPAEVFAARGGQHGVRRVQKHRRLQLRDHAQFGKDGLHHVQVVALHPAVHIGLNPGGQQRLIPAELRFELGLVNPHLKNIQGQAAADGEQRQKRRQPEPQRAPFAVLGVGHIFFYGVGFTVSGRMNSGLSGMSCWSRPASRMTVFSRSADASNFGSFPPSKARLSASSGK